MKIQLKTTDLSVSYLPCKIMQKQVIDHVNTFLSSPYPCGYRKRFSTQYALLSLLEKWKKTIDNKGFAGCVWEKKLVKNP